MGNRANTFSSATPRRTARAGHGIPFTRENHALKLHVRRTQCPTSARGAYGGKSRAHAPEVRHLIIYTTSPATRDRAFFVRWSAPAPDSLTTCRPVALLLNFFQHHRIQYEHLFLYTISCGVKIFMSQYLAKIVKKRAKPYRLRPLKFGYSIVRIMSCIILCKFAIFI